MIETLPDMPTGTLGFEAVGEVTRDDYKTVVEPWLLAVAEAKERARVVYVMGDRFQHYSPAAMWEDAKVGFLEPVHWERVALVTDHDVLRHTANAFRWMMPGEFKTFELAELDQAKAWVAEGADGDAPAGAADAPARATEKPAE